MPQRYAANAQNQPATLTIVSSADYRRDGLPLDSLVTAFGVNLATGTQVATDADTQAPGIQLPTTLAGTTLRVEGVAAPLLFVSPGQINFLLPSNISVPANGNIRVEVFSGDGSVARNSLGIAETSPAIFSLDSSGKGAPMASVVRVRNGVSRTESVIARDAATGELFFRPIDLGVAGDRVFLILYLTGIRRAPDPNRDGNVNERIKVLLNGEEFTPAYAGRQPDFAGLDQINLEIPRKFLGHASISLKVVSSLSPEEQVFSNALGVPFLVALPAQAAWRQSGLNSQNVFTFAAVENTILAGAQDGLFRSENKGADWLPVQYGFALPDPLRAALTFARDEQRDRFVVGTNGGGVFFGTDGRSGYANSESAFALLNKRVPALAVNAQASFAGTVGDGVYRQLRGEFDRFVASGLSGQTITAMAAKGVRVFAATETNGLMMSTNNGDAWSKVAGGLPGDIRILSLVFDRNTLYAGATTGLWRSTDAGLNWQSLRVPANNGIQAILAEGGNLFLGTNGQGVFVSSDQGANWRMFNDGLANQNILSLFSYQGRLYAGSKGAGVFMTPLTSSANRPPTASAQSVALDEDQSVNIKLSGSDSDGDPLTYEIVDSPKSGILEGEAPKLTYRPQKNFFGTDTLCFLVNDGQEKSALTKVTITVRGVEDSLVIIIAGNPQIVLGGLGLFHISASEFSIRKMAAARGPSLRIGCRKSQRAEPASQAASFKRLPSAGTHSSSVCIAVSLALSRSPFVLPMMAQSGLPPITASWGQGASTDFSSLEIDSLESRRSIYTCRPIMAGHGEAFRGLRLHKYRPFYKTWSPTQPPARSIC